MNVKRTVPVFLAALAGFLLGAMFVHQAPVKAQSGAKVAYKEIISQYTGTQVPSTQIVGFSCVPHEGSLYPECYVAYTTQ